MKKKIDYLFIVVLASVVLTACQAIEQAIEDTFKPFSENKSLPDEGEDSLLWEPDQPDFFEIADDTAYKLGLEESGQFGFYLWDYIRENDIKDYVSQDQAEAMLESYNRQFLRLYPGEVMKALEKLEQDLGGDEFYVKDGLIDIGEKSVNLMVHSPSNPKQVDIYNYNAEDGYWESSPAQNLDKENPLENSYRLSDLPIENFHPVVQQSLQLLQDLGAYNEDYFFENSGTARGLTFLILYNNGYDGPQFEATIKSDRESRTIIFDQNGKIISQERWYRMFLLRWFLILLPIFWMYIYPLLVLFPVEPRYTKPWFATFLLVFGIILWALKHLYIHNLILSSKKIKNLHNEILQTGKPVRAKILQSRRINEGGLYPEGVTEVEFENLSAHRVKAFLTANDTKGHDRRLGVGKSIDIVLNQKSFSPPYTVAGGEYQKYNRIFLWVFFIFDIAYAIALFLLSYHLESNGRGWRFLTPLHPWIIAGGIGLITIIFMGKLSGLTDDQTHNPAYLFLSTRKAEDLNQLLLYGRPTLGEVIRYSQTAYDSDDYEESQVHIYIQYENEYGDLVEADHEQILGTAELKVLGEGPIEVVYLPGQDNCYMFNYVE